ncbi:unnamed protein product [Caenorhabditis auriculariae]|uniref:Uncharacterized protein n=1 Tax=Caenorhabditis auriculariae TaxID=2777116 RepID=A0A8S1HJ80_9PELO|nr:unnamed protein product [Caenorhabditis auriculariae]
MRKAFNVQMSFGKALLRMLFGSPQRLPLTQPQTRGDPLYTGYWAAFRSRRNKKSRPNLPFEVSLELLFGTDLTELRLQRSLSNA